MNLHRVITLVLLSLLLCSCSVTRRLSDGEYLLSRVEAHVIDRDSLSRNESIKENDLEKYIKQRPNKRILGTNFYAWIYSLANPNKQGWLSRLVRKIGEEPVIYDSTMSARTVRDMDLYMYGRGFLRAKTSYKVDSARKRISVKYIAEQKRPYRVGKFSYVFRDKYIEPIILADSANCLVKPGDIFDINALDRERGRIADYVEDIGYYNFKVGNISYVADSTVGDRTVDVKMIVSRYLAGYKESGGPILENNRVYYLRNVSIYPDFNPVAMVADSGNMNSAGVDTVNYEGLDIIYRNSRSVRPAVLRNIINMYNNDLYSASQVENTYDALMRLGYFRSVSIVFRDVTDTTASDNFIRFEGDSLHSEATTRRGYLDCDIICTPGKRQSYTIELEGTSSSNYYGLQAKVGYQNRNIFRGFEQFDVSLTGGYEFMRNKGHRNSFEFGGAVAFSFPRFVSPYRFDLHYRLRNPLTKMEFAYNLQRRPFYHRALFSGVFGYQWSSRRFHSYVLKPIDVSVVKLSYIDKEFLESLDNPYLKNSYQSQLIGGISASYIFNNSRNYNSLDFTKLRINAESNGNFLGVLSHAMSNDYTDENGERYYRLLGIRYAQYVRGDLNFSKSFGLGQRTSLVYRFYIGAGLAYGNSNSIPFERLFFCGGSNSMRGWLARTLGPGNAAEPKNVIYPSQLGNFKLETNIEARFPVLGILNGAVFCDVGNIWFLKSSEYAREGVFRLGDFYRQLGFNTGIGARFDFNFFVFRVDWGVQIHNPNQPKNDRWINKLHFRNTTVNFGVGYPF